MKKLILLRHAERGEIPRNNVGNEVLLTEQGKLDAKLFGESLSQLISIKSSPIKRCIETAEIIGKSVGFPTDKILLSTDLGDPGFIITDGNMAWKHWQDRGYDEVNQYLLSGNADWSGFANLDNACKYFRNSIYQELTASGSGTHIWVTHDTVLAAFASRVLNKQLTIDQWPNFLSYLEVVLNNDTLEFLYCIK